MLTGSINLLLNIKLINVIANNMFKELIRIRSMRKYFHPAIQYPPFSDPSVFNENSNIQVFSIQYPASIF